jgi:hypothetical protein
MSHRLFWRSTVIVVTIVLIYFAFPILIVPSSLPAIQAIFCQEQSQPTPSVSSEPGAEPSLPIYQLELSRPLTLKEKFQALQQLHHQGMELLFKH